VALRPPLSTRDLTFIAFLITLRQIVRSRCATRFGDKRWLDLTGSSGLRLSDSCRACARVYPYLIVEVGAVIGMSPVPCSEVVAVVDDVVGGVVLLLLVAVAAAAAAMLLRLLQLLLTGLVLLS
jgi:hypothetical protein